jgi:hypothetical protein
MAAQAGSSSEARGPGRSLCGAWACLDVMELAGRLAQQHAQELKEVLRLEGDRANQARTQLHALAQALHHILSTSTSTSDGEERESGAMAMEEDGGERSAGEVRCGSWVTWGEHWLMLRCEDFPVIPPFREDKPASPPTCWGGY